MSRWREMLDSKGKTYIGIISLDISKAFDTVQPLLLINKLYNLFNLSRGACDWFQSYLSEREICTQVANSISNTATITVGLPQGSILGPKLFNLFINDIVRTVNDFDIYVFADDCLLSCHADTVEGLFDKIQSKIPNILNWYNNNSLLVNTAKTQALILSTDYHVKQIAGTEINIGNSTIKISETIKYLGLYLDQHLSLNHHVNKICSSAARKLKQFQHVCTLLPTPYRIQYYVSLLRPCLEYCGAVLFGINQTNSRKLEKMQHWALKIIRKTFPSSSSKILLPTLESRRKYLFLSKIHQAIHNRQCPLHDNLTVSANSHNLRSNNTNSIYVLKYNKENYGKKTVRHLASVHWNQLPTALKTEEKVGVFKKKLKGLIFKY